MVGNHVTHPTLNGAGNKNTLPALYINQDKFKMVGNHVTHPTYKINTAVRCFLGLMGLG